MRNGNEACLTTTSIKSEHRSKFKVVLAKKDIKLAIIFMMSYASNVVHILY